MRFSGRWEGAGKYKSRISRPRMLFLDYDEPALTDMFNGGCTSMQSHSISLSIARSFIVPSVLKTRGSESPQPAHKP